MGIETWLNWISMGLIVLWTIRLAASKQQNPWMWALASVALMAIPYMFSQPFMGLLGMLPMLFLLVLKKPRNELENHTMESATRINCSKCDVSHLDTYKYCVNCGWELTEIYQNINDENSQYGPDQALPLGAGSSQPFEDVPTIDFDSVPAGSTATTTSSDYTHDDLMPQVQPQSSFRIPTLSAESLTTKGTHLFTEGRFQEAADQFTKAIALDPKYYLAWSKRAETYLKMGMIQKAEEDFRNLEAI